MRGVIGLLGSESGIRVEVGPAKRKGKNSGRARGDPMIGSWRGLARGEKKQDA